MIWIFIICEKCILQIRGKKLLDTVTKAVLDAVDAAFKKVVHKTAEAAAGDLIENKIPENVKPKSVPDVNLRNVEEIVISLEKRKEILNKFRQVLSNGTLQKYLNHYMIQLYQGL